MYSSSASDFDVHRVVAVEDSLQRNPDAVRDRNGMRFGLAIGSCLSTLSTLCLSLNVCSALTYPALHSIAPVVYSHERWLSGCSDEPLERLEEAWNDLHVDVRGW